MKIYAREIWGSKSFCVTGGKNFFSAYGLDWDDFIQNGIEEEELLNRCNYDAQAVRCVEYAKARAEARNKEEQQTEDVK